uniref:STAGA complex 65 subunit gamma n=1 Tax=Cacopsylla melanoneura TaxID=428564 RepID=A0A8D8R1M6_9HEMI
MSSNPDPAQLWGEIPKTGPSEEAIALQNAKPILDQIINAAFEENVDTPLYEINTTQPPTTTVDPKFCAMEENVLYTIGLLKYTSYLEDLIEKYRSGTANLTEIKHILSQAPVPKFDEKSLPKARKHGNREDKNGISYFRQGKWPPDERPPEIPSRQIMLKLLTKSVMTILAHTGFDDTTGSAVSVLTEVADDYFNKFLSTLRDNTDNFFTPSSDIGFVDPMEATYHQMGIGSILVISDYYQNMVVGQRIKAKNRIIELYEELKDLYDASKKFNTSNIVHIGKWSNSSGAEDSKKDITEEYQDIPELHLSSQNGEKFEAVLAAGRTLLECLESEERGENKQS